MDEKLLIIIQHNLLSLDDVKSHFEHWRATRTKLREITQFT